MATRLKPKIYEGETSVSVTTETADAVEKVVKFTFAKKGEVRNPRGRPKGARNKIQREVREAILEAGHLAGYDVVVEATIADEMTRIRKDQGDKVADHPDTRADVVKWAKKNAHGTLVDYLREMAHKEPSSFLATVGKILPKQLDVNLQLTSADVVNTIAERRDQLADRRERIIDLAAGRDYHAEDEDA